MTKVQRKAYKADNRSRRALELVFERQPKPDSKTTARRRFEALHDAWRARNGLEPFLRRSNDSSPAAVRGPSCAQYQGAGANTPAHGCPDPAGGASPFSVNRDGRTWWCNAHERRATHLLRGNPHCDPKLGGKTAVCDCVDLTGIAKIVDDGKKKGTT